jgi:uncharacterized membrane protein
MIQHGGRAMTDWLIGFAAAGAVFLALDVLWLSFVATAVYRPLLRDVLAADVHFGAAALFYLVYLAGVLVLAVAPAVQNGSLATACALGAVLGFVAYGTYDLTNAATLKVWPATVVALDMAWGTVLTAATAGAAYLAITAFGARGG